MNNFRFDINGLRAIAVIAVVLFHFNPTLVPGGFAGVDVFFVISGFLMTGIIFRGLKNNSFNVLKFYAARANRIIPALAVLCGVVLLFSYFFIGVLDQIDVHRHVNGSMWFFSNFIYWRESGYFDTDAHEKWLLHTWSLSVEWQFYILYPAALLALRRFFSLENLKRFVVVGAVLSFAISIIITMKFPNIAYYSLPTRAWIKNVELPLNRKRPRMKQPLFMSVCIKVSRFSPIDEIRKEPHTSINMTMHIYLV
jgi:peptidoglycan/LPS O-acetylase OafA/YrhL